MECPLDYIPQHLHYNDKPIISKFSVGEFLFYRCIEGECEKPYDKKGLYDISHNRNFSRPNSYPESDVFFNINENGPDEFHYGLKCVTLVIDELGKLETYFVEIPYENYLVSITLKHSPEPCMYPHCVFELLINDVLVTRENYKKTLGKGNKTLSYLRSLVRQEISSIIQTSSINNSKKITILNQDDL